MVRKILFSTNIDSNSVLIDSWTGYCPNIISDLTPAGKDYYDDTELWLYRKAGKIQLDVYGFRLWKNFTKRFADIVLLLKI